MRLLWYGSQLTQLDTSDEAYLARHLRHERAEKKLRKQEKENLIRDRRQLITRISSLEHVDVALLVPALAALEAEGGKPARSEDALIAHLSNLHAELLADAKATLARYDKLLPSEAKRDQETAMGELPSRVSMSPTPHTPGPSVPRVVRESTRALGARDLPSRAPRAPSHRTGPSLAELAALDDPERRDSVYPLTASRRRNSSRMKAASAFGERIPDYALHNEPFETAMADFLGSPP